MREPKIIGVADCPREGCPSDTHDVTWIKDEDEYIVSTIFTCKVCASEVLWVSDAEDA